MAREDLHFRLRIPEDLKLRVEEAAKANQRSMTGEIIATLGKAYPFVGFAVFDKEDGNAEEDWFSEILQKRKHAKQQVAMAHAALQTAEKNLDDVDDELAEFARLLLQHRNSEIDLDD